MHKNQSSYQGPGRAPGKPSLGLKLSYWALLAMISLALSLPQPGYAQVDGSLVVLPPETAEFPILSTQIKPVLTPGMAVIDLQLDDLTVLEDGQAVALVGLEKRRGGVHFTLVINGERRLDLRDVNGESPYDRIRMMFNNWVTGRRFSPGDSLSLVTQEGAAIRNTIDRAAWADALDNYQPNFRTMIPDLASLETALLLSQERVVPFGVDKALLYITPPPTPDEIIPLNTLTEVARAAEIQVHVWMLGEDFFLNNDQGRALLNLAASTGGEFFQFTGFEPTPDPEAYFEGRGVYYDLTFESRVRQTGTYAITVTAATPVGELRGASSDFYLDVQPPKPILLSPPAIVDRTVPEDWSGDLQELAPNSISIEIMLEYPDDYPRMLALSQLYVDDCIVDEHTEAPFDILTWDLSTLTEPGTYMLYVRVMDVLGLSGETILTPVQVMWILPEPEPPVATQQIGLVVVGVILAAALLLLIIWSARKFIGSKAAHQLAKRVFDRKRTADAAGHVSSVKGGEPFATLLPLSADFEDWAGSAISITRRHTAFGSDPDRADQVLAGGGVDGLHARLRAVEEGFWLSDCGSAGGTWVNYHSIDSTPVQIFPGDLIHFGSVGFRFTIIAMDSPPTAFVEKYSLTL